MRRHLTWTLVLAVAVAVGVAGAAIAAETPTVVRAGNLILKLNGGVTPQALPKKRLAPIGFHGGGTLTTVDGSQPPALREVVFDIDKNVLIDVKGLPACRAGQLQAQDTAHAKGACPNAILGKGSATVRVAFPEQTPFDATGPLILFNGGVKGGVTTLFLHTYVAVPTPTAVVAPVKVTKEHKGRLGTRLLFSVPAIAGGSGSVIHTELAAHRFFTYKGEQRSWLFARCSGGRLVARGTFEFRDGSAITGGIARPCKATG
jgi:hypothetical protein